jgi:hypothetical protein
MMPFVTNSSSSSSVPSVFFDTCVISAAVKGDHPAQTSAISSLLAAATAGVIRAIASSRVRDELNEIPLPYRADHLAILSKLSEFAKSDVTWLEPHGPNMSVATDPRYCALTPILSGVTDPALIVDALDAGAQYWVTLDDDTVLSRCSRVEAVVPIQLLDPLNSVQMLHLSMYS